MTRPHLVTNKEKHMPETGPRIVQAATQFTDDQIRAVYATLIEASWEGADLFEPHQAAWKAVSAAWGVDVDDNGHGEVRRGVTR